MAEDDPLTGEIDLLCAIEYLRSAAPKAPSEAKPDVEWLISHSEETLESIREYAEEDDDGE